MTDELTPAEMRVIAGLGMSVETYRARRQQVAEGRESAPTPAQRALVLRDMARTASPSEREALEARARIIEETP